MSPKTRALAVAAAITGLLATGLAAPASATGYQRYVALGDSYASVGTLTKIRSGPLGCARSTDNYPSGVAARLRPAEFVDISCGGAQTEHMTGPQEVTGGTNPAQFDALTPDTDLVSVTIGGNDIGFGEITSTCARLSFSDPFGAPCKAHYTAGGRDVLSERIDALAPRITAVLDGIKARAPRARVIVVGYLRILPPTIGCWPVVPFSVGDVAYFDGVQRRLNATIGERAAAAGASFANPGLVTGHDVCQPLPWEKWVEGLLPTSLSVPVHPNALGQAYVARLTADTLAGSAA